MTTTYVGRDEFAAAMGAVCTPVSVVTTELDGSPLGSTVSAFASLSAEPPMVLVSLDRNSRLLASILESKRFAVNILGQDGEDLARNFASKAEDKFLGIDWVGTEHGPRLIGSSAWVGCTLIETNIGGDHVLLQGLIQATHHEESEPLVYYKRSFGTFGPRDVDIMSAALSAGTTVS